MNVIRFALRATALCAISTTLAAQGPASPEARVKVFFRAFDLNGNGTLAEREVTGCNCRSYDANRNGEITWEEFRAGWTRTPLFGGTAPRSDDDAPPAGEQAAAAQAGFRLGDRVSWEIGGITFPGTIYNVDGDRFQVDRDGYGRASEWVTASELTRLAPPPPQAPAQGAAQRSVQRAAPATASRFRPGDRVEVNTGGRWSRATVVQAENGRYRVSRDDNAFGVTTSEEWIPEARLRAFVDTPAPARPAAGALPGAVPTGVYSCLLYGGGQIGKLRILGAGVSSGVTADGSGPQYRFVYDPASGAINWTALQIVGFTVERAEYRPEANGTPNINLHYRRQAGGNLNSMSCARR
jgi:hypothetical protein